MKKLRRIIVILMVMLSLFESIPTAFAATTSTGYHKGQVIKTTKASTGSGRRRWMYTKTKDVFISEKIIQDKFVRAEGDWHQITKGENLTLSITNNKSISVQGSTDITIDITRKLKFSTSISTGKSVGASYKVNSSRGTRCRLELKCDYIKVTYMHYTYNQKGKQTGAKEKTVLIPIPGTACYYIKYK